jgi:general stress protein 26
MFETAKELADLQQLLDSSVASATAHLRSIIYGDRTLTAKQLVALLTGMKVISLATVTADCEPRISAVDGHFWHASWVFSTSGDAAKARHLQRRDAVSIAHVDGEEFAVFSHGHAEPLSEGHPLREQVLDHLTAHYGSSPLSLGPDIRLYRCRPSWIVSFASRRDDLLAARGVNV